MKTVDPVNSYKETQIKTATPSKLVIMLYDGAIRFLNDAIVQAGKKHSAYDRVSNSIIRVQDIVTELMVSLDFEKGDSIAKNLFSLYLYMNRRLIEANIHKNTDILNEVKKLLTELRAAWAEVAHQAQTESAAPRTGSINIAG